MCTRYYADLSPELRPYIEAANRSPWRKRMVTQLGRPFRGSGEIRPTDMAAVIAPNRSGRMSIFPMVWGYTIPGVQHPVVNARVESAGQKKSFREDWMKHRCIIPASYYFEWEHIRRPNGRVQAGNKYAIQPRGSNVTYLAGLYRMEEAREFQYPIFTVLTREPTPELAKIHDRMPLILPENKLEEWIHPGGRPEEVIQFALTDMVAEKVGQR